MPDYSAGEAFLQILPSLRGFAQRLKASLSGVKVEYTVPVRVEVDAKGLIALRAALRDLPSIVIDADSTPADRAIAELRQRLSTLSSQTIGVDISSEEASAEIDALKEELDSLSRSAPNLKVKADTAAASRNLALVQAQATKLDRARATIKVTADVGRSLISIGAVLFGINQFVNKSYKFRISADVTGAALAVAKLIGMVGLFGGLGGVLGGVLGLLGGIGAAGVAAAGGIAAAGIASLGIGKALSALSAQEDGKAGADKANAKAAVAHAQAVANAQEQVKNAAVSAAQARVEAARSVSDAEQSAASSVAAAEKSQIQSARALNEANKALQEAQDSLTDAWEAGKRSLEDLSAQARGNSIDQRQAVVDLAEATKNLADAQRVGDPGKINEATIAYDRQKAALEDLQREGGRLNSDNSKAQAAGIAGTAQVVAANDRLASATQAQVDASANAADADTALVKARLDAVDSVQRAQESAARSVSAADQSAADAQRSLTQAMSDSSDAGQSAADKVAEAFKKLSPAAADFTKYIYGLKPAMQDLSGVASTAFFPPLEAGLKSFMTMMPMITQNVGKMAGAFGGALQQILVSLTSPFWQNFFKTLADATVKLLPSLTTMFMTFAQVGAQLVLAFLPFAPLAIQIGTQFANLLAALAPFIGQLLGGLLPVLSVLFTALTPLGPILVAMGPVLNALALAFAQVLGALLQALLPIIIALTPLIVILAQALADHLTSAITRLTPAIVGFANHLSANPGLVLHFIEVLLGVGAAIKPILFVFGILFSFLARLVIIEVVKKAFSALGLSGGILERSLLTLLKPFSALRVGAGLLHKGLGDLGNPVQALGKGVSLLSKGVTGLGKAGVSALGPFGIILAIFTLLYSTNENFRNTINQVIGILVQLVGTLVTALMPAFTQIIDAIVPLIGVFVTALMPIISLFANIIVGLVQLILPPLVWIITNVIVPVITTLANIFSTVLVWVINNIVVPTIKFLSGVITDIGGVFNWLWLNAIQPAFGAIGDFISWTWNSVIKPVFDFFSSVLDNIGKAISWFWHNVVEPAFKGVGDAINWVWVNIIKATFDDFVNGLQTIQGWVTTAVKWIGDKWSDLKKLMADPINSVIDLVWNNGLRKMWNTVADLIGLGELGPVAPLVFATGGVVPGYAPGNDTVPAMLSPGESVFRPEATKAFGTKWVSQVNMVAKSGGIAGVQKYLATGGEGPQRFADGGVVEKVQAAARSQVGKPYLWASAGPDGYDCSGFQSYLANIALNDLPPYHRRFATGAFGSASGSAGGFIPGTGSAFVIGVSPNTGDGIGHTAGTIGGLNVESRGGNGVVVGPGARGAMNPLFPWHFYLPQVGGQFTPGDGSGSGFLKDQITNIVKTVTDPALAALNGLIHPPPQFLGLPGQFATSLRDDSLKFFLSKVPFDNGGIASGMGLMRKNTMLDERVLDPQETQQYPTLTRLVQQIEAGRLPVPAGVSQGQYDRALSGAGGSSGSSGDTFNITAREEHNEDRIASEIQRRRDFARRTK